MTTDYVNRVKPLLPLARQRFDNAAVAGEVHRAVAHDRGAIIESRCGQTLWPAPGVSALVLMSEDDADRQDEYARANGGTGQSRCPACFPVEPSATVGCNVRRFALVRQQDVTGVSGTGTVAVGCQFENLRVAMSWLTTPGSEAFYQSIADVESIHGHDGATKVVWLDD